jgi:hypothetical protein
VRPEGGARLDGSLTAVRLCVVEAASRHIPEPHPLDDPEVRKAQQERLLAYVQELEAEISEADLERSDKLYAELLARAETWPE